jgi:hypothetical protein
MRTIRDEIRDCFIETIDRNGNLVEVIDDKRLFQLLFIVMDQYNDRLYELEKKQIGAQYATKSRKE